MLGRTLVRNTNETVAASLYCFFLALCVRHCSLRHDFFLMSSDGLLVMQYCKQSYEILYKQIVKHLLARNRCCAEKILALSLSPLPLN